MFLVVRLMAAIYFRKGLPADGGLEGRSLSRSPA
jgi:hypothetical protein